MIINRKMFEKEGLEFDIIGIVLIAIGAFAIGYYGLYLGEVDSIFWFCYLCLIILGFGILAENGDIVISQLNILTIPAIIWTVDFAYLLVMKHSLLGITDYFWAENTIQKIVSLQHIVTIPLAFYALSGIKVKKTGMWKFSFLQAIVIYGLTWFLTDVNNNVNYAFRPFFNFNFGEFYPLVWLAVAFLGVFITNFFIIRFAEFNE